MLTASAKKSTPTFCRLPLRKYTLSIKTFTLKTFRFKDRIPKKLTSGVVYKTQGGLGNESYYDECIRYLNVKIGEHIRISPLTKKKVKPKGSAVRDHLLLCHHLPSFENFSVLTKENRKYVLKLKKSTLIMRDKPSLNRNTRSAPLYLFDRVKLRLTPLLRNSILGFI